MFYCRWSIYFVQFSSHNISRYHTVQSPPGLMNWGFFSLNDRIWICIICLTLSSYIMSAGMWWVHHNIIHTNVKISCHCSCVDKHSISFKMDVTHLYFLKSLLQSAFICFSLPFAMLSFSQIKKSWHKSLHWPLEGTEFDLSFPHPSLFANGCVDTSYS